MQLFVVCLTNELLCFLDSLYGNKGLCGVPSLPDCPLFWENGGLSKKGKIAIAVSCVFGFCLLLLVLYIICIRRRRNDYDFGLPQDLMCEYEISSILFRFCYLVAFLNYFSIWFPCNSQKYFSIHVGILRHYWLIRQLDIMLLFFEILLLTGSFFCFFKLMAFLPALAAKRNRYQRQKSLMLLEMESQHAKALTPFTPQ